LLNFEVKLQDFSPLPARHRLPAVQFADSASFIPAHALATGLRKFP
jgi:hypothetical protein